MTAFILGLGLVFGMLYSAMPAQEAAPAPSMVEVQMGDEKPLVTRHNDINHGELLVTRHTYRGNRTCVAEENSKHTQCLEAKDRVMGIPVLVDSWQKDGVWNLQYADDLLCRFTSQEIACAFKAKTP